MEKPNPETDFERGLTSVLSLSPSASAMKRGGCLNLGMVDFETMTRPDLS